MNIICYLLGIIAIALLIQLGRIHTELYHIEHDLERIAEHTSKEYRL